MTIMFYVRKVRGRFTLRVVKTKSHPEFAVMRSRCRRGEIFLNAVYEHELNQPTERKL